jgi:hypothetical protein
VLGIVFNLNAKNGKYVPIEISPIGPGGGEGEDDIFYLHKYVINS